MQSKILYDKPFSFEDIQIEHVAESSRHLDETTDAKISELWDQEIQKEHTYPLRDNAVYRLENIASIHSGKGVQLQMSTISYRYLYIAMRYQTTFPDIAPRHGIFTGSFIETGDGWYVFGKRTKDGSKGLIGGAVQPDEMIVKTGNDLQKNLYKEIHEELGVSDTYITKSTVLGIILHSNTNIGIQSHTLLSCNQQTLIQLFKARADKEMEDLLFVQKADILQFLKERSKDRVLIADLLQKNG